MKERIRTRERKRQKRREKDRKILEEIEKDR